MRVGSEWWLASGVSETLPVGWVPIYRCVCIMRSGGFVSSCIPSTLLGRSLHWLRACAFRSCAVDRLREGLLVACGFDRAEGRLSGNNLEHTVRVTSPRRCTTPTPLWTRSAGDNRCLNARVSRMRGWRGRLPQGNTVDRQFTETVSGIDE